MKKYSLAALAAAGLLAGGLSVSSASAADLGGNCCADLEERVAELEATTARKGNRKVSLTISGWVAEQVQYWDDGVESNVYVSGIGRTLQSHFKLTGQATIAPGWYAGYVIHVEVGTVDSFTMNADSDESAALGSIANDTNNGIYALQSFWFVKSDHLGKLSVGKQSQASDNTAILVDGSGSLVPANWVLFDGYGFGRIKGTTTVLGYQNLAACHTIEDGIGGDCNGITENVVRYDSPVFGGFSVSASWGEDDMWDVAARYAGEHGGFKVAVAAAYTETTDENLGVLASVVGLLRKDVAYFQVGGYVEHVATGLWAYGAYGHEQVDSLYTFGTAPDNDTYYFKAGLRERWVPLGHTVVYGEYGNHEDALTAGLLADGAVGSDFKRYGLGVVQEIDAAAMSLWLSWRHHEGDFDCRAGGVDNCAGIAGAHNVELEDFDIIKAGALINF